MSDPADSLLRELDSFAASTRERALRKLVAAADFGDPGHDVNMHAHSFYSYNASGASPSRIVYEARTRGLYAAGLCDFDVLDGLEEFHSAGAIAGLRTCVYLETRAYVADYAEVDINSPGEPGVAYVMGGGFAGVPSGGDEARVLRELRDRAQERNLGLVERMNAACPEVHLDYERDVVPLTPAGVPTERHIISAWIDRALKDNSPEGAAAFVADFLELPAADARELARDRAGLEAAARSRMAKRGGLAYLAPDERTFPALSVFLNWVRSCGAIPMTTWLDGTREGESDAAGLLDYMAGLGACGLNIIPDRNWNVAEGEERRIKIAKLREIVAEAVRREIPVNIGTELNKDGLPFADDLDGPVLRDLRSAFSWGARVYVGHAVLSRYAGYSYTGAEADAEFGEDAAARNRFFAGVGALDAVDERMHGELRSMKQASALDAIRDSVRKEQWIL